MLASTDLRRSTLLLCRLMRSVVGVDVCVVDGDCGGGCGDGGGGCGDGGGGDAIIFFCFLRNSSLLCFRIIPN